MLRSPWAPKLTGWPSLGARRSGNKNSCAGRPISFSTRTQMSSEWPFNRSDASQFWHELGDTATRRASNERYKNAIVKGYEASEIGTRSSALVRERLDHVV